MDASPAVHRTRAKPRGTTTLLFTDVEGSTRLLEADPDGYKLAIARLFGSAEVHVGTADGAIYETVGDGFHAAFARASDAVAAALAIQLELREGDRDPTPALLVRAALYTGEVARAGGEYVGLATVRCALLLDLAHGGQTLVSEATARLAGDNLPPGVELGRLGVFPLRTLERPEVVYEMRHLRLPERFPPLRAAGLGRAATPAQLTSFVGRVGELDEVGRLLRRHRLVTLVGPGGIGKTRLALRLSELAADRFRDGVAFVPLGASADTAEVLPAVAAALGLREPAGGDPTAVEDVLRDRSILVVLDGAEQAHDASGPISRLVTAAPGLTVLVTSRSPLHLGGERVFEVPPMALPDVTGQPDLETLAGFDAVRLLVDRARAVDPSFELTEANAPTVAAIAARLDGWPLAIELAAARMKLLGPEGMLDRLRDRLPVLTGGPRDLPERQRTLRATIAWSEELLDVAARRLFARTSVFAGSFDLPSAEAVCGFDGLAVVEGIESLLDHSLLRRIAGSDGQARFAMLGAIREYASTRLEEGGEADVVRERHATAYLELAVRAEPELNRARQRPWFERLETAHDDLRAAIEWSAVHGDPAVALRLAGSLYWFWRTRGHLAEGRRLLELALAATMGVRTPERAKALVAAGALAGWQGDYERSAPLLDAALRLAREIGDLDGEAAALSELGANAYDQGDLANSAALDDEALGLRRRLGDDWQIAASVNNAAVNAYARGDLEDARRRYAEAMGIWRSLGDELSVALVLGNVALVDRDEGDLPGAAARLHEAIRIRHALGDRQREAWLLRNLALISCEQGDAAEARRLVDQALELASDLGDRHEEANALADAGSIACAAGDCRAARDLLRRALDLASAIRSDVLVATSLEGLAGVSAGIGEPRRAALLLGGAERIRERAGFRRWAADERRLQQGLAPARDALGADEWAATVAEGRRLETEAILVEARG